MSSFSEKLLSYYHLDKEGYARLVAKPSFSVIPTLENDDGAKRILARLEIARAKGESLIIYGDYDTDGVMATSIMKKALEEFGSPAKTFLPSRYQDGYGLNAKNAERIAGAGYDLVLLVDNGVAAYEGIQILNEHSIDVLIIDHHEINGELPKNAGIVHPDTSHYPAPAVSAGYLSFIFSCLLLGRVDDYLLTLGALSTLSDMMPLKEHNRTIVRLALENIARYRYPIICDFLGKEEISADDLSMSFIPAINAIGRIEEGASINRLVNYFAGPYDEKARQIGSWMAAVNENRKALTKEAAESISVDEDAPAIFLIGNLKEGLNGLLANRLLGEYKKPIVVLSPKENNPDLLVGSIRSLPGFDVMDALDRIREYLVAGGGHPLAGGLTIERKNLETVKKEIFFLAMKNKIQPVEERAIPISPDDLTLENLSLVESLSPFGQEWKKLLFEFENGAKLFSFSLGAKDFAHLEKANLQGEIHASYYRGQKQVEFLAAKIR